MAVDGGANFVMDQLGKAKPQLPDIVTGDFDSIRSDVLTFYKEKVSKSKVKVVYSARQGS